MMTTPVPVIAPMPMSDEAEHCPKCGRPEDTVEACKHCGHQYPEDEGGGCLGVGVIIIGVILLAAWVILTIGYWLVEQSTRDAPSLLEVLKLQWQFLRNLRIW